MTAFAKNLQAAQLRYWHSQGMSAADVFDVLQLGTSNEKLFQNPLFYRLIDFIKSTTSDKETSSVLPTLYSTLSSKFNTNDLVKYLVNDINAGRETHLAPKLLLMRLLKGQLDGESKRTVLNVAKLNTGSQRMNGPLKVTFRKFSGFFTRIDSQWDDLTQLKEMFGESKTGEMLTTTNEESSVVTRAERLLHKQFREIRQYWATPMEQRANL
ncbi:unnamed protein product [Peronospora farinosa]|nr:unnamed protein product [Peronospora farinosa]